MPGPFFVLKLYAIAVVSAIVVAVLLEVGAL